MQVNGLIKVEKDGTFRPEVIFVEDDGTVFHQISFNLSFKTMEEAKKVLIDELEKKIMPEIKNLTGLEPNSKSIYPEGILVKNPECNDPKCPCRLMDNSSNETIH